MQGKQGIHFEVSERKILLRLADLVFVIIFVYGLELFFPFTYLTINTENIVPIVVLLVYFTIFGTVFELYDLHKASKIDISFKNIVLASSVTVLFYLLTPVVTPFLPEKRLQIIYFYLAIIVGVFLWRLAYTTLIQSPRFYKKVLLIGEISNLSHILKALHDVDPNYKIIGFINSEDSKDEGIRFKGLKEYQVTDLNFIISEEKISEILVASFNSDNISTELYHSLINLLERGFTIREFTQVYEEMTYRVPIQFVGKDFYKYFPFSRSNQNKLYQFFRRLFDILFSILGVLIGLILLPLVLIGNLIANRGPLFYTQERVGKNAQPFNIIKLRTMVKNAEQNGAQWAQKNDKRITPFGNILRRLRIDEIPQVINVLKGDMSIIGPRPERPYFVTELAKIIPFYETRHIIKPGLTGWAQIQHRYGYSVEDSLIKLQYDLFYIKHRSIFLDINIIVKTVSTVLYYRGQ
ncbi:exopolysaccharide biosynthesis polyprenyl glycosylphosphotransferase [Paucihalobacter ruber]|uniref:Exopolysaccharide biosynthesis polyprenyl glycosylphosphotransferase n=1 Tax=Paucihalobacter ruber TaxID=2567861 RepID=A0A506PH24_9FLAO|nr:exopolysaccharide biosynthesis polyprenyl glycosylphosphotransferase [Paucihalobacter ruber]TPV32919.1 exopolysaccharide biosynthesis polyprenyl glycosylphosphotransferase [Paucihalobacter ruber]